MKNLSAFQCGFLEAVLFGEVALLEHESNDQSYDQLGCTVEDFCQSHPNFLAELEACDAFEEEHAELIDGREEEAGADFYFTRAGHGTGFWDGAWAEHGETLTKAAKSYGSIETYCTTLPDTDEVHEIFFQ